MRVFDFIIYCDFLYVTFAFAFATVTRVSTKFEKLICALSHL